jgi:hypothetical protein
MSDRNGPPPEHVPAVFPFWTVWCPQGASPPRVLHTRLKLALKEADRLAGLNPGRAYYVLRAEGYALVPPVPGEGT